MCCQFESLPWEICHTIFDYLNTFDLLNAFNKINSYLDTILHSYHRIQLNFKSIQKSRFHFICEHVHPEQIQSLLLSDDEHTIGQTKLFMFLLPLIRFINLQLISIHQIDDANLLCLMLSHLENHHQISSISVVTNSIELNKKICRSITETLTSLPCLKYLTFMNSSTLTTLRQPLSNLTHLTLHSCVYSDLSIIFGWVPNLLYLRIFISYNQHMVMFDYIPRDLNSLIIESKSWLSFDVLEHLLSHTSSLKRFILETTGELALLDGHRWKSLIQSKLPYLKEFALNISPEENTMTGDDVLIPFQNTFWTTEKHWHMACFISYSTNSCVRLFSVPYFSPSDDWYPPNQGFFNYSLTPYSFNDTCKELKLCAFHPPILSSFKHIQTLSLQCALNDIEQLQTIVNLLSINHLKLEYSIHCPVFYDLLQAAPAICELTLKRGTLINIIESLPHDQCIYEQIKTSHVTDIIDSTNINQITRIFPKVERVSLFVKKREDINLIFNQLPYLMSTILHWIHPFKTPSSIMEKYLEENNICTDGTYCFHLSTLTVWND